MSRAWSVKKAFHPAWSAAAQAEGFVSRFLLFARDFQRYLSRGVNPSLSALRRGADEKSSVGQSMTATLGPIRSVIYFGAAGG